MTIHRNFDDKQHNPLVELVSLGNVIIENAVSKEDFIALSERYPYLQIEREKNGKLTIMSPILHKSGNRESTILIYLGAWWLTNGKKGDTLSSSTGVDLPDGSTKSTDCGWVSEERLSEYTLEEQEKNFLQAVPNFIAEVRSRTDSLTKLKKKMTNSWIKNGVELGWLIDPYKETAYIYRPNQEVEVIKGFSGKILSGENVMPGMECPLDDLKIGK